MIRKRVKKIYKLTVLIAIRQIWKLVENLYNLIRQPFLTIKKLATTKDKSQIFLVSMTALMPIVMYISARLLWDYYRFGHFLPAVGGFFKAVMIVETVVLVYLGYWMFKVIKNK